MSARSFNFPVSILIRDAQLMAGALRDDIGGPVVKRLPTTFVDKFATQINQVSTGSTGQKAAAGNTGQLTQAQNSGATEVKRLTAGARNTAKLAFPDNDVVLRQEFQVGNSDPADLATLLERATTVHASCIKYAAALAEHGWQAEDSATLVAAITTLGTADETQESSKGTKKAATSTKNTAANKLYTLCQSLQNAVDLAYPEHKAATDGDVVNARTRFLMDTFPPAPGSTPDDEPETNGTGTPATHPPSTATS